MPVQLYDYVSSELVHNKTYAHRLPPTFIEQIRGLADYRENAIFHDKELGGIGNSELTHPLLASFPRTLVCSVLANEYLLVASRAALNAIVHALQRVAFNGDPLQFMLIQTTYQPFISLFHQTEIVKKHPELAAIRMSSVVSRLPPLRSLFLFYLISTITPFQPRSGENTFFLHTRVRYSSAFHTTSPPPAFIHYALLLMGFSNSNLNPCGVLVN